MIRPLLAASASALALALAAPALAQQESAPLPVMDFGTWGVGLDAIDPAVDPGDDLNAHVNARWIAANPIPADRSSFGVFDVLNEQAIRNVETLVAELAASNPAPGSTERRIVDAYNAYLDTAAIEAAGLAPAWPYLTRIYTAPDLAALVALSAEAGYPAPVQPSVTVDDRDPDLHVVTVNFDGMGLPDRDYYLVDSERNAEIRTAYKAYLATMLGHAGYADPAAAADAVYAFEHQVALIEWDRRMMRNPELTYNELSRDQLAALAPQFPVAALLQASGFAGETRFLAPQIVPDAARAAALGLGAEEMALLGGGLPAMMQLLADTPLATVKAWMASRFLTAHAPVLPAALDSAQFDFYGRTLSGQQEQRPRAKRAIAAVEGQLGEQLGQLYVARHFPPQAKAEMDQLVANLRSALRASLEQNSWLGEATVAEALAKLDAFTPMIGYPDSFESYDGLEIRAGDPLGNRVRAIGWALADQRARLGQPVDRSEWAMLPQAVNAYYNPSFNQIVFPAAILQAPFFSASADPSVNYGAIGAVIGHEIGHGFDDTGSQFDGTGALRNWWQPEDRAAFEERAGRLKVLIEQYCPVDDGQLCLSGDQSIGETLGDVVGLQMAYRAYRLSLNGEEAPVIDGLTGDQRFFLGFAQVWRGSIRPEALRNRVMTANHPPNEFRLNNAVRHLDAFYTAFDVGPDDALYLPPEQRVSIW